MTDELQDELAAVAAAAEQIAADRPAGDADLDWDATTWGRLHEAGLTSVAAAERLGGGGSLRAAAEVLRTAGAHALRLPLAESTLATWLLEQAGLDLPEGLLTVALDATSSDGTARRIPYGRVADRLVLLTPTGAGAQVTVHDLAAAQLQHGATLAGDPLDDLDVTGRSPLASALVSAEVAAAYEMWVALTRLVLMAGAAATVQALTVQHVRDRVQFGRPLAAFQAVQQQVAELAGEVAALQIGADAAVLALDRASRTGAEAGGAAEWMRVATAKCDADRSVHRLTAIAHQLHGAIGATSEHALRRFTLRLWSWREEGGTGRQWAERVADRVLQPEGPGLWAHVVGE